MKQFINALVFGKEPGPRRIALGVGRGLWVFIDPQNNVQRLLGLAEQEITRHFVRFAPRVDDYVELGASDGYYCLLVRKFNPGVRITAYEPQEHFVEVWKTNRELNGLPDDAATWHPAPGGVPAAPLSALIGGGRRTLLKIDIDGGELEALRSGGERWTEFRGAIILEVHSRELERACIELLRGSGFTTRIVDLAWWRSLVPERRPLAENRWVIAEKWGG